MEMSPLERLEFRFPILLPSINAAINTSYSETASMLTPDRCNKICWRDSLLQLLYPAVQTNVCDEINSLGIPDLQAILKSNKRGSHHAEIIGPGFVITVSSADGEQKPRPAVYRDELSTGGQMNWFRELDGTKDHDFPIYFTITHQIDKNELKANDIRIILMTPSAWSTSINESICGRQMLLEDIADANSPKAKEETIGESVMPELKKSV